jgi:tetratricopeptide (TPR) repeat protein
MREVGDRQGEAVALNNLGSNAERRGDYDEAERLYRESLAIMREVGHRQGEAVALNNLGSNAERRGDYDEAERLHRESVRIKNGIGVPLGDWYIENGYTDPDEKWEYPPPRENSE